jgi:hypothetical protein
MGREHSTTPRIAGNENARMEEKQGASMTAIQLDW